MTKLNRNEMPPSELKKLVNTFLKENDNGALATCGNDKHQPRCSPVMYTTADVDDEVDIFILSAGGTKFGEIEENSQVCLLVNTDYTDYKRIKGVQVFGTATTSYSNPRLIDEAYSRSNAKEIFQKADEDLKVIKIIPDEIIYLDSLETGDRTKQVLDLRREEGVGLGDRILLY